MFARRSFALKDYSGLLGTLLGFFDQVRWEKFLRIESIMNETIEVAREESVQLNYKVYLLEQLI